MPRTDVSTQKWSICDMSRHFVHDENGLIERTYSEAFKIASKLSETEGKRFRLILSHRAGKRIYARLWREFKT